MNRKLTLAAVAVACCSSYAMAQSSVTLYGLISTGISYSSNTKGADGKGHGTVMMSSGVLQPPRWGITGNEDLGSGLNAIFTLESGFR
ncbi:porin [Paraburkholderia sp. ZP32-5]|uniref:porin n=1 Tax=Paraburkholderia sp. ZP32-5 TaxID=2883245 RepID=UPI001F412179|nr:porin [Paraburkholderia sp. ZP32-5]